jgi:hypothetical protein
MIDARRLKIRNIVFLLLTTAILLYIIMFFIRLNRIDRCYDRGGRWNPTEEICEY